MVRNRELKQDLLELDHRLEMIQTVLLVSNPESSMAAEAYDGLRKTIVGSLRSTQVLEASLAQLDQISRSTDDMEVIRIKLRELMGIAGVELVEDYNQYRDAFDIVGSGSIPTVAKPAYVVVERGAVVVRGVLELADRPVEETEAISVPTPQGIEATETEESDSADPQAEDRISPLVDAIPPTDEVKVDTSTALEGEQK